MTYDTTHKHNVTQAGDSSHTYQYDFNGNIQNRNGSIIFWTSYNYPSEVQTSTESASFDYGPDRQRWRMKYDSASGIETTFYVSRLFEKVTTSTTTDYRHYIYAANRPVMVISRTTAGAVNVRSLLTNHQGSISTIVADSTGALYAKESFTAYGLRRDAGTWSGAPTSGDRSTMDGVTREGYTFQTVLGAMGLNHMNGRVQDAVTGIFLSPDLKGGVACDTQSWNLHNYVSNNPLSRIDPTGFDAQTYSTEGSVLDEITVEGHRDSAGGVGAGGGAAGGAGGGAGGGGGGGRGSDGALPEIVVTSTRPAPVVPPPPTLIPIPAPDLGQPPSIDDWWELNDKGHSKCFTVCRDSLEPAVSAAAGAAGGAAASAMVSKNGWATLAGTITGGVTGYAAGWLSTHNNTPAGKWVNGVIAGELGTLVNSVAAGFLPASAGAAESALVSGWTGGAGGVAFDAALNAALPGFAVNGAISAGAGAGLGVVGTASGARLATAIAVGVAAAATTYAAADMAANKHCESECGGP